MSQSNLSVSNVTVDKAVRNAQQKIVNELHVAPAVNDESFINFNDIGVEKQRLLTQSETESMAKSGVMIVDYTKPIIMGPTDPFTLLFDIDNTQISADVLASIFNLSITTPSRLIRVIRSGINALSSIANTILGTPAVVDPADVKYVYFQVNGIDGNDVVGGDNSTQTPVFITNSDWSFVVSLKSDKRLCFNVLV